MSRITTIKVARKTVCKQCAGYLKTSTKTLRRYFRGIYWFFRKPAVKKKHCHAVCRAKRKLDCEMNSNGIRTHNYLVRKRTLNNLAKFSLRTKWLWVQIPLLSLKLQISRLFRARSSLTIRQL